MKFPVWNYFRASFLVFIQGFLVTILLYPWLQLAGASWGFLLFAGTFWVFCTTITSIWVAKKVAGGGKKGLPILLLGLVVPLGFIFAPYYSFIVSWGPLYRLSSAEKICPRLGMGKFILGGYRNL